MTRWMPAATCVCVAWIGAGPATVFAQAVGYHGFTPFVLSSGSPPQVPFEAEVTGTPTRVTLDLNVGIRATVELRDDGSAGDRTAGDHVYTVLLSTADIVNAMRTDDVHRVFVGFLTLLNGSTTVFRGNIFADVYGSDAGTLPIVQLSSSVQATTRLVNIVDPAYFVNGDPAHVTTEFYRWFGDDYDFLNLIYQPARFQNRTHFQVRNDVDGIGLTHFDNTARYGSAGRLQGVSQFPIPDFFDGADTGHIHELGHQWINFLTFAPLASAIPHWPVSTMASGVMGFSIGGAGGEGGSFTCDAAVNQSGAVVLNPRPNAPAYNDLDLYLMGLLPADQVRPQAVFVDQNGALSLNCAGQTYAGAITPVSVQDVTSRYGARNPPVGQAPNRFSVATILVTRDGLAQQEAMWLYSWFADRAELRVPVAIHSGFLKQTGMPFYVATGQRASLDMRIAIGEPDFSLVAKVGTATVASGSPATFTVSVLPTRQSYDADVALSCGTLPAHASCSFSPTRVRPGTTGGDVTLTIRTADAAVRMEQVAALGAVLLILTLRVRRERALAPAMLALFCACGGSGSASNRPPAPTGGTTAAGTYVISVIGTSGSTQHNTTVSLVVQ